MNKKTKTKDCLSGCCDYCWGYPKPGSWEFWPLDNCLEETKEHIPKSPLK